jgi:hypothetical protein
MSKTIHKFGSRIIKLIFNPLWNGLSGFAVECDPCQCADGGAGQSIAEGEV